MTGFFISFIVGFNYFIGFYYGIVNFVYSILLTTSLIVILRYIKRIKYSPVKDFSYSPETPPVSILIPAYNEERIIVQTLKSALSMNYPFFDVIVINDGSLDKTLEILIMKFKLRKIDVVYRNILKTSPVRGFYYNPEIPNLIVIDKEKAGKADALNCGVNASKNPYVCSVDADSLMERDALLRLMAPVLESTIPVVAAGGVVRILNGTEIRENTVSEIKLPRSSLALFQIVEYLRAFLFGRVGWDTMNSILILSGTFSLFNKAAVMAVGGYNVKHVSEDMELVIKLHRYHIKNNKPYRIKFISDPICWSEVPEKLKMLGRQRRRWHLGLIQCIVEHRALMLNPKYGKLGLFIFPYYFFFEMLGPIVELLGYIIVPLSYIFGLLSYDYFLLFLILAIFYGVFLSTIGVFLEELTYRRYPKWSHLFKLLLYGVFENFGYRQINSFWRFQAIIRYIFGKRKWEYVEKKGVDYEKNSKR
ncbi:MAG: glycosyl transferase [Nitrospirae bacterium RBG_13_41_22]|nr:MAG: glycosyl transferase [Nitrospirae bacterium RBG_13_41_22]